MHPGLARSRRRLLSIRAHLLLLVLGVLLPALGFAATLSVLYVRSERAALEQEALQAARRSALAVDRELDNTVAAMRVLAAAPSLARGDLAAFDSQARASRAALGQNVVLSDLAGQQVLNTRRPMGEPLPHVGNPGAGAALRTGRAVISDLFRGAVSGESLLAANMPVTLEGRPAYVLTLTLAPARMAELLVAQDLPKHWVASVIDGQGVVIARSREAGAEAGRPPGRDPRRAAAAPEGIWISTPPEGGAVLGAYARTKLADWMVTVGVPARTLEAPLRHSLLVLGGVGAGALLLSLALARWLGHRITGPLRSLAEASAMLGRGEAIPRVSARVREVDAVAGALARAAIGLRERARARTEAETALRELADTLERKVDQRTRALVEANRRLVQAAAERDEAEAQLRQAQKMEAVGQLTGGIAHDFNNLLTVVIGSLDLMRRRLDGQDGRVLRLVDNAIDGAQRAATLTQRLLAFSRRQPLSPVALDANQLVAGLSDLLRRTLGERYRIETVLAAGLWSCFADPNQLENALLNLAVNARDAMPEGGHLTIETANTTLDEAYMRANAPELAEGEYVMIAVADTGTGMTPDVLARAFDPFFTTKPLGQGTGLGLSQVYGFVRQSGGHVTILSEPERGTTLKLYLPRHHGEAAPRAGEATEPASAPLPKARGEETILMVEDEAGVRRFGAELLRDLGYRVLEAEDGATALRLLEAHPEVALLFTDVVLPGDTGRTLADAAQRLRPELQVLFTTGYTRDAIVHDGVLDADVQLLGKPFTVQQLARKLRDVLDG